MHYVILGNSGAALAAVRAIRSQDPKGRISLLSAENCPAYSPVVLPYLLSGSISPKQMCIADEAFYREQGADLFLNSPALGVDAKRGRVYCQSRRLSFDRLLIATGASARTMDMFNPYPEQVLTLRTLADANSIIRAAQGAEHVLMQGAGLVGLESAYALNRAGKSVTVMARSNHLLSQNADEGCARLIQKRIETQGVRFLFGHDVADVRKQSGRLVIVTDRQREVVADMVIVGKGVQPNIACVREAGLHIERGIRVDLSMQTSCEGIYAAGDVAESRNLLTGEHQVIGNWPSACFQGHLAGLNMAGKPIRSAGEVNYNILPVFNQTAAFAENIQPVQPEDEVLVHSDSVRGIYRKFIVRNDRLVGAILLGSYQDAGLVLQLITRRTNIASIRSHFSTNSIPWGAILNNGRQGQRRVRPNEEEKACNCA